MDVAQKHVSFSLCENKLYTNKIRKLRIQNSSHVKMLEEEESYERNAPSIATTRACGNSQLASKLGSANRDYRVEMGTSSTK